MSSPRQQADVIVIGGGIMGTASAFFLARRGRSVILLEQGLIGRQASGTNFGNVRRQGRPFNQLPLANRARAVWGRLPELIGEDGEFAQQGHLRIALDGENADRLAAYRDEARHYGLDLDMLSANSVRDRFPWLSQRVIAGCHAPLDGHANPRLVGPAFGRAAARLGAQIHENTPVTAIGRQGPDFAVTTADGRLFTAPIALLTAGAWSGRFAAAFGEPAPLLVKGPQMSVTEPLPYFLAPSTGVATQVPDDVVYFRQVARGNIVIGGPRHGPASTDSGLAQVLPGNILLQLSKTRLILPILDKVRIIRSWSGVESYTPDSQPVLGPSPGISGLYYAFGFSGAGFQLGPGVGEVMAELIDCGHSPIDLTPFAACRFAPG